MERGGGGGDATTTTIEIVDIEQAEIPPETFAIPAGYRETALFQQGPALPDLNNVTESPAVPNLNDLEN